jgi:4'-phosphopantetheinyl transferase
MPAPTSCPAPGEVRVYYAEASRVIEESGGIDRAVAWLQAAEPERFARFRFEADRMMFLAGRVLARTLVGRAMGVAPEAWRWREGPHGRPEVADPATTVRFNLSHSAGIVVCALADDREVGVDVEHLARGPVDLKMVRRYCSAAEADDVEAQGADRWQDRFLMYWTLKEAYLKARGLGVSVPLSEITFDLDDDTARVRFDGSLADSDTRWTLRLTRPTPRHLIAVAASEADGIHPEIRISEVSL